MLCHIFKTGEHTDSNGVTRLWTQNDLDKICSQFKTVHNRVPICIGHPKSNTPAYGWIDEVKRIGDGLYCTFKDVQECFKTSLEQGLFKNRSISLDKDLNIRHIAFLGAQAPAIKGLEEFCFEDDDDNITTIISNKEDSMDLEQQVKDKDAQILKLQQKIRSFEAANKLKEFQDFADEAVNAGNILAKHKECVINILHSISEKQEFSDADSTLSEVKKFIKDLKVMNFEDVAKPTQANPKDAKDIAEELHRIMKEKKVDLAKAFTLLNR